MDILDFVLNLNSLHFTSLHFTSLITFLTLFLKVLGSEGKFSKSFIGSFFRTWLVLLTEEYKNELDATYYIFVLLIGSTCFGHYYAHHQELMTIMLVTTLVVSFLVCCRFEVRCS